MTKAKTLLTEAGATVFKAENRSKTKDELKISLSGIIHEKQYHLSSGFHDSGTKDLMLQFTHVFIRAPVHSPQVHDEQARVANSSNDI